MNNGPTRTATVFAIAAAMLLLPFVAHGAGQTPAADVQQEDRAAHPVRDPGRHLVPGHAQRRRRQDLRR